MATTTPTWQAKVKAIFGPNGYDNSTMRRSLQAIVLYEAKRCASRALATMKPFQRKVAFLDQCQALVESLDLVLYPHQKAEVLWRTATSKEQMDGEIAWKRAKSVEKELEGLAVKIKPFVATAKSHQEAVDRLVQNLYETLTGFKGKSFPDNWEHAHNQNITAYRLYYHYDVLDPTFPDPVSPRDLVVPTVRPEKSLLASAAPSSSLAAAAVAAPSVSTSFRTTAAKAAALPVYSSSSTNPLSSLSSLGHHHHQQQQQLPHHNNNSVEMAALLGGEAAIGSTTAAATIPPRGTGGVEERRRLMEEVRAHLDLLKQFEGAVPENEINQRKRELFAILPSLSGSLAALTAAESSTSTTTANSSAVLFGGNTSGSLSPPPPPAKKAKGEGLP